jgi:hypothetical protein
MESDDVGNRNPLMNDTKIYRDFFRICQRQRMCDYPNAVTIGLWNGRRIFEIISVYI